MLMEDLLGHTIFIQVEDRGRAWEVLRDTPPSRALSLKLIGRSAIDIEHTRNGELQVVKVSPHHSPEVVLSRGVRLTHLINTVYF